MNFQTLTGSTSGQPLAINNAAQTTVHTVPAGYTDRLILSFYNTSVGATRTLTIDVDGTTFTHTIGGSAATVGSRDVMELDIVLEAGSVLKAQGGAAGIVVMGSVIRGGVPTT